MLDRFPQFVTQAVPLPSSLSALAAGLLALICTRTKRRVRRLGALAGLLLLASAGVTAAPALRTLNVPGADFTQARGTNGSGQIPGWYLHGFSAVQAPLPGTLPLIGIGGGTGMLLRAAKTALARVQRGTRGTRAAPAVF